MTISSTVARNDFVGNGVASVFAYGFRIFTKNDLLVTTRTALGVETTLAEGTDYTVSGVGDDTGGDVTLVAGALASGLTLTIRRIIPLLQSTDIRNQGDFFPEIHEDQFDRDVMLAQQQQDEIDRSAKVPESITASAFNPTLPATIVDAASAGLALIINTGSNGLSLGSAASFDLLRLFNSDTFNNLNILAVAAPTTQRFGYATDLTQFLFYTGDVTVGNAGWLTLGG